MRFRNSANALFPRPLARAFTLCLKDERGDNDGDCGGIAREDPLHPLSLRFNHGGMHDGVEFLDPATLKRELGESGAYQAAVGSGDFGTEAAEDLGIHLLTRFHEGAAEFV